MNDLDGVLGWLTDVDTEPVASKLVPGASPTERRYLAALGGLVRDLVPLSYRASWPSDVVEWIESGPTPPSYVVSAAMSAIANDPDRTLASLYACLVSGISRRPLGTFFTPLPQVRLMLDMWARSEPTPSTVIDIGAGVGVFTASAARKWPEAIIYGVDINPVTLGLLALRIYLGALPSSESIVDSSRVRIIRDDFTAWIPESWNQINHPRLIIGNPPYTRWQLLSTEDRARLRKAAGGLCGSRASLSTLMTAISLQHLDRLDGLCLLLPGQWLESQYAVPLREYLSRLTHRRIKLRLMESRLFLDALVDATVLMVGHEQDTEQEFSVATWPGGTSSSVDREELIDNQWRGLFSAPRSRRKILKENIRETVSDSRLADFCTVRRGTATGANAFFVLSDREVVDGHLPRTVLLKLVRRLHPYADAIDDDAFDSLNINERRWLLNVGRDHRQEGGAVDQYLKSGELTKIPERHLCQKRKDAWYDLTHDLFIPDVIMTPMTRGQVRYVENTVGAAILNNLYGWRWHPDVPLNSRRSLLHWLRSETGQAAVLSAARSQGEGLRKIEPNALANIRIPASIAHAPRTIRLS